MIAIAEIDITAIRSQGVGGQNVNNISTAQNRRIDQKTKRGEIKALRGNISE